MTAPWNEIGGAVVALPFTRNGERLKPGTRLSRAEFFALQNGRALVGAGYLKTFPPADAAPTTGHPFVVHRGGGAYDVIVGARLNAEPLSKDEAEALARGH